MLFIGNYKCIPSKEEIKDNNLVIFNFSSFVENVPQLLNLIPKCKLDYTDESNLYYSYYNYIFNNDYAFIDFMYIITKLYEGFSVYIIINDNDHYYNLAELLSEIIKDRYGYISIFINDHSDYENIKNKDNICNFSIHGLNLLDNDKYRFLNLLNMNGLIDLEMEEYPW